MGFNKKYVKPLSVVKEELEKYPENLRYYLKADCLIGSKESIDYIYDGDNLFYAKESTKEELLAFIENLSSELFKGGTNKQEYPLGVLIFHGFNIL